MDWITNADFKILYFIHDNLPHRNGGGMDSGGAAVPGIPEIPRKYRHRRRNGRRTACGESPAEAPCGALATLLARHGVPDARGRPEGFLLPLRARNDLVRSCRRNIPLQQEGWYRRSGGRCAHRILQAVPVRALPLGRACRHARRDRSWYRRFHRHRQGRR